MRERAIQIEREEKKKRETKKDRGGRRTRANIIYADYMQLVVNQCGFEILL